MYTDAMEILDDRFKRLVFGNVRLETLWTGGRWLEGPAYFAAGKYLVFSDIPNDRVMRFDETPLPVSPAAFICPASGVRG